MYFDGPDIVPELKKTIHKQLEAAIDLPKDHNLSHATLVHELRKNIKRIRSLFRLLKPAISDKDFYTINEKIGETASWLTLQRESTVNLETFQRLKKKLTSLLNEKTLQNITDKLNQQVRRAYSDANDPFNHKIISVTSQLSKIADTIKVLKTIRYPYNIYLLTIEKTFTKAAIICKGSKALLYSETFHKWRKFSKHLLLQLKFSPIPIDDNNLGELRDRLEKLTDLLGKEHDLYLMDKYLRKNFKDQVPKNDLEDICSIIETRRRKMQVKAFKAGAFFYSHKLKLSQPKSISV